MATIGKFIIVFKDGVTTDQIDKYVQEVNTNGGEVTQRYDGGVLNGFAAAVPESLLSTFQSYVDQGIVDYIEPDGIVTTQ